MDYGQIFVIIRFNIIWIILQEFQVPKMEVLNLIRLVGGLSDLGYVVKIRYHGDRKSGQGRVVPLPNCLNGLQIGVTNHVHFLSAMILQPKTGDLEDVFPFLMRDFQVPC